MNPEQLLDQAAVAMSSCQISNSHTFTIGYEHGQIICVPTYKAAKLEIEFARFSAATIALGLSPKQWDTLSDKIANFYHQKGLL